MISLVSIVVFLVCLLIILNDYFFKSTQPGIKRDGVSTKLDLVYSGKHEALSSYIFNEYPKIEDPLISKSKSAKEVIVVATLALSFLLSFIACIYLSASARDLRLVLTGYHKLEKIEELSAIDGSISRYFKIFKYFTAGVMDVAFGMISFYIWFMVHRRAFHNRQLVDFKFLRQLDYGLFFAGLYVLFLAITNFLQIDKHLQFNDNIADKSFLISFSILNSIFLIISCIYFGHSFIFFKKVKNKGLKLVISTIILSAVASFTCYKSAPDDSVFTKYFSIFDIFLSILALAVFSIGVAISFYGKGYKRFLPAFSLFAGFCFILIQITHFPYLHDYIYGNYRVNLDGKPIIIFCTRVVGFTSEILIGVLFLLIGKTWSTAYENDINRAVVGIYTEILKMEENNKIKSLLQRINSLEKENAQLIDNQKSGAIDELQKNLEIEIARLQSPYMSNRDFARCLMIVGNNRITRKSQNIYQPEQIAVPIDIKKFITSEYEIEKEVLKVYTNLN